MTLLLFPRPSAAAPASGFQDLIAAQAGKVAWWKLDEAAGTTAADSAGGNPGTHSLVTVNQDSLLTSGVGKSAAYSEVAESTTTVPNHASLQLAGDLSLEMVFHPTALGGAGQNWMISKGNSYGMCWHAGRLAFLIRDSGGTYNYLDCTLTDDDMQDTTYHVVGTWTDSTKVQRLYLNGTLDATGSPLGFGVNVNAIALCLGAWADGGGENYTGRLDEVVLYNVVLSPADITAHAAAR